MKKLLLTVALVAVTATLSYAQGTVTFQNGTLNRATLIDPGVSTIQVPTTAGLINYGLFWGTTAGNLTLVPTLGVNSTASAGIISAANPFPIPGSTEGQSVFLQVKGWSASFGSDWLAASTAPGAYFGQTRVVQTTLAPTAGPGTVLWQSASGTAADRFFPLALTLNPVPEPTSFALAGLGAAALLIFRRRN
jgi:hypothetical protein